MKGTKHIYLNQNMQMSLVNSEFNENAGISGLNFGPSIGIGIKIPVMKHEFIFITDYIHGIRELSNNLDPIYNKYFRIKLGLKI